MCEKSHVKRKRTYVKSLDNYGMCYVSNLVRTDFKPRNMGGTRDSMPQKPAHASLNIFLGNTSCHKKNF